MINDLESMLKHRDFYHQSIKYSFNWNLKNHKEKLNQLTSTQEEIKKLGSYLKTQNVIPSAARNLLFRPMRPFASLRVTVLRQFLGKCLPNNNFETRSSQFPRYLLHVSVFS